MQNILRIVPLLAELLCGRRPQSGAPWVSKSGNLSMREILVVTPPYAYPSVQTLGEVERSPKTTRRGGWGGECHLFLEGNYVVLLGNCDFLTGNRMTTVAFEKRFFFQSLACLAKRFSSTDLKFKT